MFVRVQEETFTFTPEGEEEEVHIFSGQLRLWLHKNAPDKTVELTFPEETEEELIKRHGLEAPRMASMTEEEAKDPVIIGLWPGGTHVLIDGAHRRWFWSKRGVNKLRGWAVPYEIWRAFTFDLDDFFVTQIHRDGSSLPQRRPKN